jgi:hypothetical protein
MFRHLKKSILSCICLAVLAAVTTVFFVTRASTDPSPTLPNIAQRPVSRGSKNVLLRPEARAMSRRLGRRFEAASRATSASVGTLSVGGNQQQVTIVRRQSESDENVQVVTAGGRLTWNSAEGIRTDAGALTDMQRLVIERLIFDSPDRFVLAQLSGASYRTIAENVRPNDAVDGYSGPAWTLVRVSEPPQNQDPRATSHWRIYHINSLTGLIDRIESESNGQKIEVQIVEWAEQNGETFPKHIKWFTDGQLVMEYQATAISHSN